MRSLELNQFRRNLSDVNTHLSHYVFIQKQFLIDNEEKAKKTPDKFTDEIYTTNEYKSQFKVKLSELEFHLFKTSSFIYDSLLAFCFLGVENYLRGIYKNLQTIQQEFVSTTGSGIKKIPVRYGITKKFFIDIVKDSIKIDKETLKKLESLMGEKFGNPNDLLNEIERAIGKEAVRQHQTLLLQYSKMIELPTLKRSKLLEDVLVNLGIAEEVSETITTKLCQNTAYLKQEDVDTIEYLRLRRNAVVHRDSTERFSGIIQDVITEKAHELERYWERLSNNPSPKFKITNIKFDDQNLILTSHLEIIDIINIFRYVCEQIDREILNIITEEEWITLLFWHFKKDVKRFDYSILDKFMAKFNGYSKQKLNVEFDAFMIQKVLGVGR